MIYRLEALMVEMGEWVASQEDDEILASPAVGRFCLAQYTDFDGRLVLGSAMLMAECSPYCCYHSLCLPHEMGRHIVFSSIVCLSVRPSVCPSVRPSVTLSCPLYIF